MEKVKSQNVNTLNNDLNIRKLNEVMNDIGINAEPDGIQPLPLLTFNPKIMNFLILGINSVPYCPLALHSFPSPI